MADRSVTHATFTIERTYPVPPARVFQALADPDMTTRWFAPPLDSLGRVERTARTR